MTHSTHFIYGYMASDIWLRTILIARKETCCRHIGYSFQLAARVLLYASSHRQDNTYHSLCYTSRGALVGMRNNCIQSHSVQVATLVKISYLSIIYISLSVYSRTQRFKNIDLRPMVWLSYLHHPVAVLP